VFPKPPPAESVVSCGDGGILGPVVGVMGVLQAVEAIKVITSGKLTAVDDSTQTSKADTPASMLLYSANSSTPFRTLKLRSRRAACFACSAEGGLTLESMQSGSLDYVAFCGVTSPVKLLLEEERIQAREYAEIRQRGAEHVLVDVREKIQFNICNLEGSINVPFSSIPKTKKDGEQAEKPTWLPEDVPPAAPIYVLCRLGNDSQVVAKSLLSAGIGMGREVRDIKGGLKAWKEQVDNDWPEY
jgi:adenylyltransferase/sulfurtransferase